MAAWYEPPTKPRVPHRFYLGVGFALYLTAMLLLLGLVLWKLAHPLPKLP